MLIRIPIPRKICLTDIRRLRLHAAWYKRQAERHGPDYGSKRFTRARQRHLRFLATAHTEPVLVGMS